MNITSGVQEMLQPNSRNREVRRDYEVWCTGNGTVTGLTSNTQSLL